MEWKRIWGKRSGYCLLPILEDKDLYTHFIQIDHRENDTVKVVDRLGSARTHAEILNVLSTVHGPWSFVFWQVTLLSLSMTLSDYIKH